jgi:hypothetical protein
MFVMSFNCFASDSVTIRVSVVIPPLSEVTAQSASKPPSAQKISNTNTLTTTTKAIRQNKEVLLTTVVSR